MDEMDNLDVVFTAVGYGRWQLPVLIITLLIHTVLPIHMVGSTLLSAPMSFRCLSASSPAKDAVFLGVYTESAATTNETMVFQARSEAGVVYDNQCHPEVLTSPLPDLVFSSPHPVPTMTSPIPMFTMTSPLSPPASVPHLRTTTLVSCPQVEYDTSIFQETIISEFNLICERMVLRPLYQMLFSIGAMIGGPIGGIFSDRYGRRRAIQVSSMMNLLGVVVIAASPWYTAVLLARLLVGLSSSTMVLPAFSLAQEVTPPRLRTVMGMGLGTSFSLALAVFAGLGYLLKSWRLILLSGTSLILLIIPLSFIMQESPRWLVQHGRGAEAAQMLTSAFKHNRATLSPTLLATIHKFSNNENEGEAAVGVSGVGAGLQQCWGYLHLPGMRVILLVTPIVWLLHGFLYYGVILNANNFTSNNPFIYVALTGVMDGSAILLTIPLATRLGRRQLTRAAFMLAGTLLLVDLAVPTELAWIEWILVMFAFFLTAAALQVNFLYAPELFPTVIRSRGFGLVSAAGNTGGLMAPIITDILAQQAWWAPSVAFGGAGVLVSLLLPLLPETINKPLPETVLDVESRRKSSIINKNKTSRKTERELDSNTENDVASALL